MISLNCFVAISLVVIFLDLLLVVHVNPSVITAPIGSQRGNEIVEQHGSRAMGLISIVLVILSQVLDSTSPLAHLERLTVASLILASGFLMMVFILELFGKKRVLWFRFQTHLFRYSGLMLFTSLYFYSERVVPGEISAVLVWFIAASWTIWILHEIGYIFIIQRKEWKEVDGSRWNWWADSPKRLQEWWRRLIDPDYSNNGGDDIAD